MKTDSRTIRLGVLVSGRGSNLKAIQEAIIAKKLRQVEIVVVISNRPQAEALNFARSQKDPGLVAAEVDSLRPVTI